MSKPLLFYSEACLKHQNLSHSDTHPESPLRLQTILKRLYESKVWQNLPKRAPQPVNKELLFSLHDPSYVQMLERFCHSAGPGKRIDENTLVSEGSYEAALQAAGAATEMVEALLSGESQTAYSLIRPPGHHAMPAHTMGFCLFNNIALAARHALNQGLKRILILDWDAHHGNGTEHLFYQDPRVLFVSWHQFPNWPGTGALEDLGQGAGYGTNVNIPMPLKYGDTEYLRSFQELVVPLAEAYRPELILVSAGYDAHLADLLTDMNLTAAGFSQLTEEVMKLAHRFCQGKAGFILEGGYNVTALAASVDGTLQTLIQEQNVKPEEPFQALNCTHDPAELNRLIEKVRMIQPLLNGKLKLS
ncbi:histone deacetylase [bacterium (Candidatus Blackallbacteria) CG17_big_fil_post_rev_8_21_14_2_50_48_46]|uniref:Histone deacetylase n=1 Tax=bacterium (Candidatus Blackallbacteria) CG17_big_fil_post_rev_8_21_14_2_50_48_46 TaxID=2014261 RepID=A0A2M7FZ19_9BACT|nr:MAG: histone deacetylase [bacterium (Candidatus Blackallbacteria) CG18_big_fil_WC_8_21_14_2_50_49_26]PIW14620.1 MAG: histone deacetylase [bacterium (Candidatus Blackallbacteria) CG17_big_fil_post_rev_8_21_14_2_50_48_46]PIW45671.1 MAG: histone deacetylase [bacterium (Candidatus Blackallbacteria) CG13_big_fil_rev_8_21_14_2_50_49_14]